MFNEHLLDKRVVSFEQVMRWGFMCFEQGIEGLEHLWRVGLTFFKRVDNLNDINRQQFRHLLSIGVSEYLITYLERSLNDFGVDHEHVAEGLGQEQQSQRVLDV